MNKQEVFNKLKPLLIDKSRLALAVFNRMSPKGKLITVAGGATLLFLLMGLSGGDGENTDQANGSSSTSSNKVNAKSSVSDGSGSVDSSQKGGLINEITNSYKEVKNQQKSDYDFLLSFSGEKFDRKLEFQGVQKSGYDDEAVALIQKRIEGYKYQAYQLGDKVAYRFDFTESMFIPADFWRSDFCSNSLFNGIYESAGGYIPQEYIYKKHCYISGSDILYKRNSGMTVRVKSNIDSLRAAVKEIEYINNGSEVYYD